MGLLSASKPNRIVVFEHTGLHVRAAVFWRSGDGFTCETHETARAHDLTFAVPELCGKLRERGVSVPKVAVLLSAEAVGAILELPVDPARPLPHARMHETVRWELEPFVADQALRLKLGTIFVARGYLTPDQLRDLLAEMEVVKSTDLSGMTRLGDVAVRGKLVTAAQLKECLDLQQHLAERAGGELACGWQPLENSSENIWRWQVCALPKSRRDACVDIFESQGLRLIKVYPLIGPAALACDTTGAPNATLLDVHDGIVGSLRVANRRIQALRAQAVDCPLALTKLCSELVEADAALLRITGSISGDRQDALAAELHALTGLDCKVLRAPEAESVPAEWTALRCAAGAAVAEGAGTMAYIPAADPARPLLERPALWVAAAVVAAAVAGFAVESTATAKKAELARLDEIDSRIRAAQDRHATQQGALDVRRKSLDALRERASSVDTAIRFLEVELPKREALLPEVLKFVREAVNDEVVLHRLSEDEQGLIAIRGWSLSELSIQDFKFDLSERLARRSLESTRLNVRMERNEDGVDGYVFEFQVVTAAAPSAASVVAPNGNPENPSAVAERIGQ